MPMGGKLGTTIEVTITGEHLDEAGDLIFSDRRIAAKPRLDAAGAQEVATNGRARIRPGRRAGRLDDHVGPHE
jgi:hypothetical protein